MATSEITWQAPEYEYREKGVSWYWISIIIAAAIIAFSVWAKNFLFGLFIVIAEILFIVWGSRAPRTLDFSIDKDRLAVGDRRSKALREFESMSIDPLENGWAEIIFYAHARLRVPFKVLFPEERVDELRGLMKGVLKEVPHELTLFDAIEKLLRF